MLRKRTLRVLGIPSVDSLLEFGLSPIEFHDLSLL